MADGFLNSPDPVAEFWEAHPLALFPRKTIAKVRQCSVDLLEREAWAGTGIRVIRDGARCLYRKADVLAHLGLASEPPDRADIEDSARPRLRRERTGALSKAARPDDSRGGRR